MRVLSLFICGAPDHLWVPGTLVACGAPATLSLVVYGPWRLMRAPDHLRCETLLREGPVHERGPWLPQVAMTVSCLCWLLIKISRTH